jgi:hypothetical protein
MQTRTRMNAICLSTASLKCTSTVLPQTKNCNNERRYPFLSENCRRHLQAMVIGLRTGARERDIRLVLSNAGDQHSGDHFAILNPNFYATVLQPHISVFALEWICCKLSEFTRGGVNGVTVPGAQDALGPSSDVAEIMHKFILGCKPSDSEKHALRQLGPTTVMLLTLVKQWVTVYLPHCCSLFNRVHYGLLQPQDIKRLELQGVDPNRMPGSRRRNAVPFVGKDSPSRASEFAQPDISAGLTILAFRYEGMRQTDLHGVVQVCYCIFCVFFMFPDLDFFVLLCSLSF